MEDFKDTSNAEENFNVKRHYRLSRGKEISQDFFFYTCFEEEQNLKQLADEYPGAPKRFPLALKILQKQASDIDQAESNKSIETLIEDLCGWYASTQELLTKSAVLDYELHAKLVYPFVFLVQDLYLVYDWKSENRLPRIDADGELDEIWKTIEANFTKFFPHFAKFFVSYLKWCHQGNKQRNLDLASIPPVGRYIGVLRKARLNTRDDKPAAPKVHSVKKADHGHEEISEASQQEIDEAMKEVEESVGKMNDNPELANLTLIPRNSFIRRKQHKKVTDLGLTSTSVGEGQERAIQILR